MGSEPRLVVSGSVHYDHLLRVPRLPGANDRLTVIESRLAPGGMGGNVAAIAARLGARVRFAGSFARDADGAALREDLVRDGVDVGFATTRDGPSWRGLILVGAGGERAIVAGAASVRDDVRAPGQWPGLPMVAEPALARPAGRRELTALMSAPLRVAGVFDGAEGFACPSNFAALAIPWLPDGLPLFIDVETGHLDDLGDDGVLATLGRASVVYANERNAGDLAGRLTGGSVAALATRTGAVLVETLGASGCRIHAAGTARHIPGVPAEVVDTTGAGDCFAAAFTVAWLRGSDADEAGRFANRVAALSTRALGSRAGVPGQAETGLTPPVGKPWTADPAD